jgi:glutaminyl-peptide cyclotransferase
MRWTAAPTLGAALLLQLGGCPRSSGDPLWERFSGDRAFVHAQRLVDFGPRPSGSAALENSRAYIIGELQRDGWTVERQTFTATTPRGGIAFVNLIAHFGKAAVKNRFIVASHYDTKLFDTIRFVGADDGASSTAALLELARVLALTPALAARAELVFFDGEEALVRFDEHDGLYGSRHFTDDIKASRRAGEYSFAILWDMIGDRDLTITLPPNSPPELARGLLNAADALKCRGNFSYAATPILDDHVPLDGIGIPALDVIDFDYPAWHTNEDTIDKIAPESLRKVGAVTLYFLEHQTP